MKKMALLFGLIITFYSYAATEKDFTLGSPVFDPYAFIPDKYACTGANISPALFWENPPNNTKSFVLIIDDPDASNGGKVHWVLFNLPPDTRNLTEGEIPLGATSGTNSWGTTGYKGPCPPIGTAHRYIFKLYALDTILALDASATKAEVVNAFQYHVVGMSELSANFSRE